QPRPRIEFDFRSDGQHAFVFRGSRALWSIPNRLRHQVWHESVSWESLRTVEWFTTECSRLLYECDTGESQAAIHCESFWRQFGRTDSARQAVFLLRQRVGADRAADCHADDRSHCAVSNLRLGATSVAGGAVL